MYNITAIVSNTINRATYMRGAIVAYVTVLYSSKVKHFCSATKGGTKCKKQVFGTIITVYLDSKNL